jgi:deoxycytidine triphosphate deaminase
MPSLSKKREAERKRLEALTPSEIDPHSDVKGVLLSDEIEFYALQHHLIRPFNYENLKPAAYELTVGDEYFLSGEYLEFRPDDKDQNKVKDKVVIPPFDVAVLKTAEVLCLPRYLIGRWNIRVKYAYLGLLWVGGPQVDPGYRGHLFCPIYNLSDKPVTLYVGDPIAVIDFVKTTPFNEGKSLEYPFPKRLVIQDYNIDELRSALFTKAGAKLAEFEEAIKNLETRFITFTQISFAIFALVMASIAVSTKATNEMVALGASISGAATISVSVWAALVAVFSYVHWRTGRLIYEQYGWLAGNRTAVIGEFFRRRWWQGFWICMLFATLGGSALYWTIKPVFEDIRQQRVVTKSEVEGLNRSVSNAFDELGRRMNDVEQQIQDLRSGTPVTR